MNRGYSASAWAAGILGTLALASCEAPLAPDHAGERVAPHFDVTAPVITRMRGAGTLGDGEPISNEATWRQYFDFNVGTDNGVVDGVLLYVDSAVIKPDGKPAELHVSSLYPGTRILSFVQTSSTCVDFEGIGYLVNTGELLGFKAEACDNGDPTFGADWFGIAGPQRLYTHGQVYYRADQVSSGDVIRTFLGQPVTGVTGISGIGTGGLGDLTGDGIGL